MTPGFGGLEGFLHPPFYVFLLMYSTAERGAEVKLNIAAMPGNLL